MPSVIRCSSVSDAVHRGRSDALRKLYTVDTSDSVRRGEQILRPLPPHEVVPVFVQWMRDQGFVGERTWQSTWDFYQWFCDERGVLALPWSMRVQFASELKRHAERRQIRVRRNGQLRRLTTYDFPDSCTEQVSKDSEKVIKLVERLEIAIAE